MSIGDEAPNVEKNWRSLAAGSSMISIVRKPAAELDIQNRFEKPSPGRNQMRCCSIHSLHEYRTACLHREE
jgi:hypothetical protein